MNNLRICDTCSESPLALVEGTDDKDIRLVCLKCGTTMKIVGSELVKIYKTATVPVHVTDVAIPGATHMTLDIPTSLSERINKLAAAVRDMGVKQIKEDIPTGALRLYRTDEKSFYPNDNAEMVTDGNFFYVEGNTTALSGRIVLWSSEPIPLEILNSPVDYVTI